MPGTLRRAAAIVRTTAIRSSAASEPIFLAAGLIGAVGFPFYYVVWSHWLPQPYENLPLRLAGCLLCLGLALVPRWPDACRRYLPAFWLLTVTYCVPFHFSFMLFMSEYSTVSVVAETIAIFLLILLVAEWLMLLLAFVVGVGAALAAAWWAAGVFPLAGFRPELIPLFGFALLTGAVLNYRQRAGMVARERLDATIAVGSSIAHELRTPLLGIRSGAVGLSKYLPALLHGYRLARARELEVQPIRDGHLAALTSVLERIETETDYSNAIIDMLLVNAGRKRVDPDEFELCSMAECVRRALARYPFRNELERSRVRWVRETDFAFWGSELLMVHVLFNLLKNALYFTAKAGKGDISIRLVPGAEYHRLYFRDTGTGIPASELHNVFKRFYSTRDAGSGIGLSFCASTMHQLGGRIDCHSRFGEFTEFVLTFPVAAERAPAGAKEIQHA